MQRRMLVTLTGAYALAGSMRSTASANNDQPSGGNDDLDAAFGNFLALPGTKSYLIHVGQAGSLGRFAHQPHHYLFTASAYKTFVLAQNLRDLEAAAYSEDDQLNIDDNVRTVGSPVYLELSGTTPARSVLEAMITHSDNTATDIATAKVGADRVRALIAEAKLPAIRIPDSTRLFVSYLFGAAPGVDLGWPGVLQAGMSPLPALRSPLNDVVTLAGNARDFVSWYEQSLAGNLFTKPETLTEFKRIQAMSVQISKAVPADTVAYAKGGEFPWPLLNAKSLAGQMVIGQTPVTFCFIVNWDESPDDFPTVEAKFFAAIKSILTVIKNRCSS